MTKRRAALLACSIAFAPAISVHAESRSDRELLPIDFDARGEERWYWRDWTPPGALDVALLVAAEVTIVIDTLQTRDLLRRGSARFYEANPLLGSNPTDARLFATTGAAMLVTAAGWYLLPAPWRRLLTGGVLAYEIPNVARSALLGARVRF
jgi:hypothetical protein